MRASWISLFESISSSNWTVVSFLMSKGIFLSIIYIIDFSLFVILHNSSFSFSNIWVPLSTKYYLRTPLFLNIELLFLLNFLSFVGGSCKDISDTSSKSDPKFLSILSEWHISIGEFSILFSFLSPEYYFEFETFIFNEGSI